MHLFFEKSFELGLFIQNLAPLDTVAVNYLFAGKIINEKTGEKKEQIPISCQPNESDCGWIWLSGGRRLAECTWTC